MFFFINFLLRRLPMLENWEAKKVAKWFLGEWEILNSSLQCMEKIKPGLIIHNFAKSAWI